MSGKAMLTIVVSRKARKAPAQAIATARSMTAVIHRCAATILCPWA